MHYKRLFERENNKIDSMYYLFFLNVIIMKVVFV